MQSITAIIWVQAELPTERTLYHLCNLLLAGDQICEDAREVLWIFHRSKREKEHSWKCVLPYAEPTIGIKSLG